MIDIDAMKERKKLRLEILEQLYNLLYFAPTRNNILSGKTVELFGGKK